MDIFPLTFVFLCLPVSALSKVELHITVDIKPVAFKKKSYSKFKYNMVLQGYHGVAIGKAKQNAKTEIEKIKVLNTLTFYLYIIGRNVQLQLVNLIILLTRILIYALQCYFANGLLI